MTDTTPQPHNTPPKRSLGLIISQERGGNSQQWLADRCGVARVTITRLENDDIPSTGIKMHLIEAVINALGCNRDVTNEIYDRCADITLEQAMQKIRIIEASRKKGTDEDKNHE